MDLQFFEFSVASSGSRALAR
ncbi:hypothetical protein CCACVL1_23961 [Corchorus capsularis]|uniref:Uncharacterized protein n=1 Tax=Corchorus capsularis TaxID=210143 RepID=A0A1R3GRJ7_COCAP|nr:hypothetical protein CCACVL1_23961 [Corchorus capsularis]